jgi:hypothetical protein
MTITLQCQHRQISETLPQNEKNKKEQRCSSVIELLGLVCAWPGFSPHYGKKKKLAVG